MDRIALYVVIESCIANGKTVDLSYAAAEPMSCVWWNHESMSRICHASLRSIILSTLALHFSLLRSHAVVQLLLVTLPL